MSMTKEEIQVAREIKAFTDYLNNKEKTIFAILYIESLTKMKSQLNEEPLNEKEILKFINL